MDKTNLQHFLSEKPSVKERIKMGKSLRKDFPREMLGEYKTVKNRTDPISILEEQGKTRLKDLVPVRYARMLKSPFSFLRGAAAIMASDLAANGGTTKINVQTCGDMHIANIGVFASAERNLVFGINDFDETIPGPWEWDLKRMVASIVAAGRYLAADENICKESVLAAVRSYRKRMNQFAFMGAMELWYTTISEKALMKTLSYSVRKGAEKVMSKARQRTHMQVLGKLIDLVDEKYRLKENAPFLVRETHSEDNLPIKETLGKVLDSYLLSIGDDRKRLIKNYRIFDIARKVVGVGSVGTRCWVIFLKGNHDEDPLFLQIKEAQPSVLEPYVAKSEYANHGERVVQGQRLLQSSPDIFLGWGEYAGKHFYVRQLRDMKGGKELEKGKVKIKNLPEYSGLCAWTLALAHAKSGDAAIISGYAGNSDEMDNALVKFAFAYSDQTYQDHQALKNAAKSGRIKIASISE